MGKPLIVPLTEVIPREGSFALAFFGRVRNLQEPTFAAADRQSVALNRIVASVGWMSLASWTQILKAWYLAEEPLALSGAGPRTLGCKQDAPSRVHSRARVSYCCHV